MHSVVRGLWLPQVLVDLVDGCLERREFTHGVGDLAGPEGVESLIKPGTGRQSPHEIIHHEDNGYRGKYLPCVALLSNNLPQALPHCVREWG